MMHRHRRQAKDTEDGGNLLQPTFIDPASSSRLPPKSTSTLFVQPAADLPLSITTTTAFTTRTAQASAGYTGGAVAAAAILPLLGAALLAAGVFLYFRRKRAQASVYHLEAFPPHRDSPEPPLSPSKIKSYMLEKMAQSAPAPQNMNGRKKPSVQYHPDLDLHAYASPPQPAPAKTKKAKRDVSESKKDEWLSERDSASKPALQLPAIAISHKPSLTSRPKLAPVQQLPTADSLPLPRYPSSQPSTNGASSNSSSKKRLPPPINTNISPADLYKSAKRAKGSRKVEKFERSEKAHSLQSSGSTLVLPVIKPVKSVKRKPAPKIDADRRAEWEAPPPSAVSATFNASKSAKMGKHVTTTTDSSFFCQGGELSPPSRPSKGRTSSSDQPRQAREQAYAQDLDNVAEEEEEDHATYDVLEDMVQQDEDEDLPDSPARHNSLLDAGVWDTSRHSGVSGVSATTSRPGAPPPSIASN